jgi:hypothetical protein
MSTNGAFLVGLAITAFIGFSAVWYLKSHLRGVLTDLCGTEIRADFWMAFTNVTLIVVPMIFALQFYPEPGRQYSAMYQLAYQLKWVLIGLIVSVVSLGMLLLFFIAGENRPNTAKR